MNSVSQATTGVDELRALLLAGQRFRQAMADHFGLSLSETVLLGHLADSAEPLSPGVVAERMLLGTGTVTAVIDRLVQGGYAARRAHPEDRRRVRIQLTPAGRRVIRYVQRHMERAIRAGGASSLRPLAAALDAETDRVLSR